MGVDPSSPAVYLDIERHPNARPIPGVLIVRPAAPLFYANAQLVRDTIEEMVRSSKDAVRVVLIDLNANDELDITSSEALEKLLARLGEHVRVGLAHVHASVVAMMARSGLLETIPSGQIFPNLDSAVAWARSQVGTVAHGEPA